MPGHLLVIPKRHVERGSQLNKKGREGVVKAVFDLQDEIVEKLAEGCDIRTSFRPFIKQGKTKVDHFHFHLQPRELKDELYKQSQKNEKELFQKLPEEIEKFAKMFGK